MSMIEFDEYKQKLLAQKPTLKELLKVGRERKEESMKYYGQEKALNG